MKIKDPNLLFIVFLIFIIITLYIFHKELILPNKNKNNNYELYNSSYDNTFFPS